MKGRITSILLMAAACWSLAGCQASGGDVGQSAREPEESQVEESSGSGGRSILPIESLRIRFPEPAGYRREESRTVLKYTLEEGEDPAIRIILSSDQGDAVIAEVVRNAFRSGQYEDLLRTMEIFIPGGSVTLREVGGYPALQVWGEPSEDNKNAFPGGSATAVILPVGEQLVMAEGYAHGEQEDRMLADFESFLDGAEQVIIEDPEEILHRIESESGEEDQEEDAEGQPSEE